MLSVIVALVMQVTVTERRSLVTQHSPAAALLLAAWKLALRVADLQPGMKVRDKFLKEYAVKNAVC